MGGANVCVFTWVVATIFIDVKTHKNTTVYADINNYVYYIATLLFMNNYRELFIII